MTFFIRSYRLIFIVPVLLATISCGGLRAGEGEYDFAFLIENADTFPPAFVMKKGIRTTISDSGGDTSGLRVRIFSYEEYNNASRMLPRALPGGYLSYMFTLCHSGNISFSPDLIFHWKGPLRRCTKL